MTEAEKTGKTKHFMAFLSCVERNQAMTFLYVYAGEPGGNRVARLVHKYVDTF